MFVKTREFQNLRISSKCFFFLWKGKSNRKKDYVRFVGVNMGLCNILGLKSHEMKWLSAYLARIKVSGYKLELNTLNDPVWATLFVWVSVCSLTWGRSWLCHKLYCIMVSLQLSLNKRLWILATKNKNMIVILLLTLRWSWVVYSAVYLLFTTLESA